MYFEVSKKAGNSWITSAIAPSQTWPQTFNVMHSVLQVSRLEKAWLTKRACCVSSVCVTSFLKQEQRKRMRSVNFQQSFDLVNFFPI